MNDCHNCDRPAANGQDTCEICQGELDAAPVDVRTWMDCCAPDHVRAAVTELIEAAELVLRYHDAAVKHGGFNLHIDQERALRAALARMQGETT